MFEINALNIIRYEVRDIGKKGVNANNRIAGRMDIVFKDIEKSAGNHSITWDASNSVGDPIGAGVYFYQLQTKDFVKTRKMVLLK